VILCLRLAIGTAGSQDTHYTVMNPTGLSWFDDILMALYGSSYRGQNILARRKC
jgi:hypothetical protein